MLAHEVFPFEYKIVEFFQTVQFGVSPLLAILFILVPVGLVVAVVLAATSHRRKP